MNSKKQTIKERVMTGSPKHLLSKTSIQNTFSLSGILLLFLIFCLCTVQAQPNQKAEQWLEDFDYVLTALKENHPNLYYRITEEELLKQISNTQEEIKNAETDLESFYSIKRFVAKIQDGHTSLSDGGFFGLKNSLYSFRAEKFSDEVFLTAVHKDYAEFFGAKIIEYNGLPINKVHELTSSLINIDNKFGKISTSTYYLSFPKIMSGLLKIDENADIKVKAELRNGEIKEAAIGLLKDFNHDDWLTITSELGDKTPLHLKNLIPGKKYYWFEHLKRDSAIYFQFNLVRNQSNSMETWYEFNDRLWNYINQHDDEINKLIIDVRYNTGGSGRTLYPFLNKVIANDKFREGKNLFVLMGDETFSAPVILINELKVHTDAIFIGIPPSHPFNFFSNRKYIGKAPNSGITIGVASRLIDNAWSSERDYFCPDIPAPFTGNDYFSGNDPALNIALDYEQNMTLKDYAIVYGAEQALEYSKKWLDKYKNFEWWIPLDAEKLEDKINKEGSRFMYFNRMKEAFELLKLNTLLFPDGFNTWDSLAEWYYISRDYKNAKIYYQKSYDINPKNKNAARIIQEIDNMK